MTTDTEETVELARRALPPETLFATMRAQGDLDEIRIADLGRVSLGNMTACRVVLTRNTYHDDEVLVSVISWNAYPFRLDGRVLHWSYVAEKLVPGRNPCDAVALTLLLGVALKRPVGIRRGCDCHTHREVCAE